MTCEVVDSILPVHLDQRWRRKSKSSSYCSAINCTNRQSRRPDLSFFRFPRKKERCQQWVQNTRRQDLLHRTPEQLSTHYCLCSLHFELNQFSNKQTKNRLNWNAVPTLFDFPNPPKAVSHNIQTEHSYCSATDKVPRKEHSSVSTTPETPDLQFTPNVNDSRALKKERQRTFRLRKRIQQIKLSMGKNTTESKTISDLIRGAGEFLQEPALSFFASQLHNASGRRSARGRRWSYSYKLQRSTENMKRTRNPSNIKKQSMQDKVKQVIRKKIQTLEGPATASGHAAVPDPAPASVRVPPPAPSPASAPAPAAAAECDSNLAQETDASAVPAKKKKTVVTKPYNFTKEQQGDLVEWYQTHRELHDKGHRDCRSTDLSNAMLEDKAKEFPGCSYDQLCQWFKSQRTRFRRLGKSHSLGKPGSASLPLTDREQWIVEKWGFVRNHIVRVHRRKSSKKLTMGKSSCATSSEGETDPPEGPSGSGTADKQQHAKQKPACTTAADCVMPVQQRQREMFTDIMQQAKTTAETINVLSQPRTPHERIVYAYSTLLREEMLQIPESQWHIFCLEGLILARAHRLLLPSPMRPMP